MKLLTIEAYERFRNVNQPELAAAARVGESARRLQEFSLQIEVVQKALEEETGSLRTREEDLRLAQEQRDAFLSEFSPADREKLIKGREPSHSPKGTGTEAATTDHERRASRPDRATSATRKVVGDEMVVRSL